MEHAVGAAGAQERHGHEQKAEQPGGSARLENAPRFLRRENVRFTEDVAPLGEPLARDDRNLDLAQACLMIAQDAYPELEVERYLGLPNLVVVPDFLRLPKARKNGKARISRTESALQSKLCVPSKKPAAPALPLSMLTESYRKLRTALFLSRPAEPPKTILFTSGSNGEGKTMTVANTAIMLAQMDLQVLLIDADLRRPSCHKALKMRRGRGLTDFLAGQESLDNVIKPTPISNLFVLNCGSTPPNPTELVGSRRMHETLAALKDHYDFILIDSPPVMPVSDAEWARIEEMASE